MANRLGRSQLQYGEGRGKSHCVRLNATLQGLLEMAKPEGQSMAAFLRECAVQVAFQRLEESQK